MEFNPNAYKEKDEAYYAQDRSELLPFFSADAKSVLDVGCSTGRFGGLLKARFGVEVTGVEPHPESAQEAAQRLDTVVNDIFPPESHIFSGKFDVICFNDVLEHMAYPEVALRYAQELLSPQGRIIASIPNIQCYLVVKELIFNGDFRYRSSGILDKTHLRFFTKKSIIRLFEETGFQVEKIEGIAPITDSSRLLRLAKFLFGRRVDNFLFVGFGLSARKK